MAEAMPQFADEMITDIRRKIAWHEREIRKLRSTEGTVIAQYANQGDVPFTQLIGQMTRIREVDMSDCPLTIQEMVALENRHRIVRAIAELDPQGRVHVGTAARWLHHSGIVNTVPVNMAKALARSMRNRSDIWINDGAGRFKLRHFEGVQQSPPRADSVPSEEE